MLDDGAHGRIDLRIREGRLTAAQSQAHGQTLFARGQGTALGIGFGTVNVKQHGVLQQALGRRGMDGLHELAMDDAIAQHTRAKLEIFGDALFMVLYSPIRKDGCLEFVETQLFAGKGYVISARYGNSAPYSTVRQRCEARPLLFGRRHLGLCLGMFY